MVLEKTGGTQLRKALQPVVKHITWQHYRQWLLRSLAVGSAAALLMLLGARFFPVADSPVWAGVVGLAGFCLGMARAWLLRPGFWEAAVAADSTGLKERAATAWQLQDSADVLAECQRRDALIHLAGLDYRQLLPRPRPKRELGLTAGLMVLAMLLALWPNPLEEAAQARKQARVGLTEARTDVKQLQKQLAKEKQIGDELKKELDKELEQLQQELKKAKSLEAGAAALAKREKELTGKLSQEGQKAKLAELARMFQENGLTKGAAEALKKLDDRELRKKMEDLAAKLQGLDKTDRQKLAKLLEEAAGAMQKQGDAKLAEALQKTAEAIKSGEKNAGSELTGVKEQLARQLAATAGKDRLAEAFQQALAQAKGNMLAGGNRNNPGNPARTASTTGGQQGNQGSKNGAAGAGSGSNASGNPGSNNSGSGSAGSGGANGNTAGNAGGTAGGSSGNSGTGGTANGSSGGTGATGGATGGGSGTDGSGGSGGSGNSGNGGGSGNGGAGGNGSGSGSGNGNGSGNGSGNGGGQGAGGGAGTGSTNQAGGTFAAGGPRSGTPLGSPPDKQGRYEQIYVPSRLGGGGTGSQVKGSAGNSGSSTQIDLADGPITGGSLLPYSEVLTQYQAEARESLDKQYIPENLKDMVKNYFTGLAEQ